MKKRYLSGSFLVTVMVLVTALVVGPPTIGAQQETPATDGHRTYDHRLLRDGQPLPGAGYPWQRVARPAPAGWEPAPPPEGIDLDVTFVSRAPTYLAYCVDYPGGIPILCPGTEDEPRWPAPGEVVTFTAHIVNKGTLPSPSFDYEWSIDGVPVLPGTLPTLGPGAETTVSYQWAWAHLMDGERVVDDHVVGFTVDPQNLIAETYESNNLLLDRTNALAFRIAITPEMYEAYNTPWDPAFSYSAEDWLQRQVAAMNSAFANSAYPTIPDGATERVRIDTIQITSIAPPWDRTSDGGWFVDADYRIVSGGYDPVTDVDWNLVHELSHQVGLIDLYNLNISTTSVKVLDREGEATRFGFSWPRPGLMGGGDIDPHTDPRLYSSHSAAGISSSKGYRRGYYGEYQFDIPQQNYLLVLDSQGNPAGDVQVALYQRTGPPNWVGELDLDNTPEITGVTGVDGRLLLDNRPVGGDVTTRTGHTLHDNPFGVVDVVGGQNRFLLELSKGDHEEFVWTDITAFNLAFWQGDTGSHTFTIASHVPPPDAPFPPQGAAAQVEGDQATLCWEASSTPGVTGYYVYRAASPTYEYEWASGLLTDLCYAEAVGASRVYAVTAVDGAGRESGFSNFAWAPRLINPHAVAVTSDGLRTVLDPQNGYALLRQGPEGRYLQNVGSVHYHLEYSTFIAADGQDRLLFSHPGDAYNNRHSVRVSDGDATPILEFGERGSGPGQFETPAGVAAVGQPSSIEGPYDVDEHTLLLLHFDGSYDGAQGEVGTPGGTTFEVGRYDQGVSIDDNDTLTYGTAGNLERTQGAIEFWIRPNWDGADYDSHVFFEVGDSWFNRMRIMKDGANNLRFMVWDSATEYGVAYNVAYWQAGEWHHVAATWEGTEISLFVDGQQRDSSDAANPPDSLADTIFIGSSLWHDQQADAVLDELRISDMPRVGAGSGPPYRFLVVDSGNHRVQAFDELGNFVTTFGTFGSGPEQFDTPQGVAVDGENRVIVADTGNDRLQLLSFDGTQFGFLQSMTSGFLAPTSVAVNSEGLILVADTGNNRVVVLNAEGDLLGEYTEPNDGHTGPFDAPQGVCWDGTEVIVVADTGNQRVASVVVAAPEADFTAMPVSGVMPLTVQFTNTSSGLHGESLWDFGDGVTSTLESPSHTYSATGTYTVSLTVSYAGSTDTETKPAYITVWEGYRLYLPLVFSNYAPPGAGCQEMIQNGGFEDSSAWEIYPQPRPPRYVTEEIHSGSQSLLLGLKPGESDVRSYSSVRQAIVLPLDLDNAVLTFWIYPLSDLDQGDRQECLLLDQNDELVTILMQTNVNTAAWHKMSYDLTGYAGQSVKVYFNAYNDGDGSGVTGFYLDDVSVESCSLHN